MSVLAKNAPIGVLDSGVGGLSVLKHLQKMLPGEDFIFLGDTARTPYGTRTEAEIRGFVEEMLCWMEKQGVKMVVIACNTLTMLGVETLQKQHPMLLVGMSKGENLLDVASRARKVGVFATPFTISTGAHKKAIHEVDPQLEVYPVPCAKFVPLIEGEQFGSPAVKEAVHEYAQVLKKAGADAVILSCTHYPFLKKEIAEELGADVRIIDPAQETSMLAKKVLEVLGLLKTEGPGSLHICCTADKERVARLYRHMLPEVKADFEVINLQA